MKDVGDIKNKVIEWKNKVGREEIISRLVQRKFSARTAEMLADGTYRSEPGGVLRDALINEMAKDGISLAGGKAY